MLELSREHPRYGYRRIWALLRREGWRVNRKRVHRLWRQAGAESAQEAAEEATRWGRARTAARGGGRSTRTTSGLGLPHGPDRGRPAAEVVPVVDEYTRECLGMEVGRAMTAEAS